jgi:CheY-like chemotaxis protein
MPPKTILVIEDDSDIREALTEALEAEGYAVVTAGNGQEGIDALRRLDAHLPDLILLDLMMPVKNGFEFHLERMSEPRWKAIPVVVMTADSNSIQRMEKVGGQGLLRKPVDLTEMLGLIARHSS